MNHSAIVRTNDGRLFRVMAYEDAALAHAWSAVEVKRVGTGGYVEKARAAVRMIRRAGCTVVAECAA